MGHGRVGRLVEKGENTLQLLYDYNYYTITTCITTMGVSPRGSTCNTGGGGHQQRVEGCEILCVPHALAPPWYVDRPSGAGAGANLLGRTSAGEEVLPKAVEGHVEHRGVGFKNRLAGNSEGMSVSM